MTNINVVNIKYVDQSIVLTCVWGSFGFSLEDFGDLLGTFGVSLSVSWEPPWGLCERLGGIFGTKCPNKPSQIPERATQVFPKCGQASPRDPQMATKSAPRDH